MADNKLYTYMFCSRNKDNKNLVDFKQRTKTFLAYESDYQKIVKEFHNFRDCGVKGEVVRLYKSVNARNPEKIREMLTVKLITDKPDVTKMHSVMVSIANKVECKAESKWLIDFDVDDVEVLRSFTNDLFKLQVPHMIIKTPNGYAIVCEHGFDTRELFAKWKDCDITLKKDDMLFVTSDCKN